MTYEDAIKDVLDAAARPTTLGELYTDAQEMVDELVIVPSRARSAAYNPDQPRDPKGSETGGQWTDTGAGFSDEHIHSLEEYVMGFMSIVNVALRDGEEPNPEAKKIVAHLDEMTTKGNATSFPHQMLYRGLPADMVTLFKVGAIFEDRGFVSTTRSKEYARQFIEDSYGEDGEEDGGGVYMHIEMPGGRRYLDINKEKSRFKGDAAWDQKEVLLPRGSRFKVVSKEGDVIKVQLL